jgi:phage antirepressor YoqD-like protein
LGQRGGYLINESGFYALVLGSELPSAKRFKRWITKEVIPQIRKTGGYIPIKEEDTNETIMAKAYLIATETLAKQKELVNKLQPLADVAETRIEMKGCLSLTDVTKSLGFKRGQITRWAKAQGYLHLTLTEVNKVGEKYFKVYSSDQIHNQIGITEEGLQLIRDNKETIMTLTVKKAS